MAQVNDEPPFKVGDVVALKSSPDLPLVVDSVDLPFVEVVWITSEGEPKSSAYSTYALMLFGSAPVDQSAELVTQAGQIQNLAHDLSRLGEAFDALSKAHTDLRKDAHEALTYAKRVYPELDSDSMTVAVRALADRYETIKREANATIKELEARII